MKNNILIEFKILGLDYENIQIVSKENTNYPKGDIDILNKEQRIKYKYNRYTSFINKINKTLNEATQEHWIYYKAVTVDIPYYDFDKALLKQIIKMYRAKGWNVKIKKEMYSDLSSKKVLEFK